MKTIFIIAILLFSNSLMAFASIPKELVCATDSDYNKEGGLSMAMSCVSKVSIEKDKLMIKKIKLEIEALELEKRKSLIPKPKIKKIIPPLPSIPQRLLIK